MSQKLDWVDRIGGTSFDNGLSMAVNSTTGNVYIGGYFRGTVDFDPSSNVAALTSIGTQDVFFAKYDKDGNYIWAKSISSDEVSQPEIATDIILDLDENIYITGFFGGTADFDPSGNTVDILSNGATDIFFAKYDKDGNYIWAKSIGGSSTDYGNSIFLDKNGFIYLSGVFKIDANFDPSNNTNSFLYSNGSSDIYFAKYDNDGNYVFAKSMGGQSTDGGESIQVDDAGNIYLTGSFYSASIDFDPSSASAYQYNSGDYDGYIAKYDNNGNYLWANAIGSSGKDWFYYIVLDNSDNIYISGIFSSTIDLDPSAASAIFTTTGITNFYAKYDKDGHYIYAHPLGQTLEGGGLRTYVAVDANNNVYASGAYTDIINFGGKNNINIQSKGSTDAFLAKFDASGINQWFITAGGINMDYSEKFIINDNDANWLIIFQDVIEIDANNNATSLGSEDFLLSKFSANCISLPNISINGISNLNQCTVTNYAVNSISGANYVWSAPTGVIQSNNAILITTYWNSPGIYPLIISISNNCSTVSSGINVTVTALNFPKPAIQYALNNLSTANTITGAGYQWYINDQIESGQNSSVHTSPLVNANYQVQVSVNNCVSLMSDPMGIYITTNVTTVTTTEVVTVTNCSLSNSSGRITNDTDYMSSTEALLKAIAAQKGSNRFEIIDSGGHIVSSVSVFHPKQLAGAPKGSYTIKTYNNEGNNIKLYKIQLE